MDLTRKIIFRDYVLNDEVENLPGGRIGSGLAGCTVDSVDWSDLDVVQFTEKRSLSDGLDAGDVYLGGRRLHMTGTLYQRTRALLYDELRRLRAALSPALAFRESPGDKGYLPLYFSEPTNDIDTWPDLAIPMRLLALPHNFQASIVRNAQGGSDASALGIPWQCLWTMRDPRIYAECPIEVLFPDAGLKDVHGNWTNPATFYAPLNAEWIVTSAGGVINGAVGDSQFTITVPTSTHDRVIRFKGDQKILTFEEQNTETLQMGALAFLNNSSWPLVPPGVSSYSITFTGSLALADTNSKLWSWPSWA